MWRVTPELRFVVSSHAKPPTLQQLWVHDGTDKFGHVVFAERQEWRNIPRVVLEK
jgi:hypothetical protein